MKFILICLMAFTSLHATTSDEEAGVVYKRNRDCSYFMLRHGDLYTIVVHISGTEIRNSTPVYGDVSKGGTITIKNSREDSEMIAIIKTGMEKKEALILFYDKCNVDVKRKYDKDKERLRD